MAGGTHQEDGGRAMAERAMIMLVKNNIKVNEGQVTLILEFYIISPRNTTNTTAKSTNLNEISDREETLYKHLLILKKNRTINNST